MKIYDLNSTERRQYFNDSDIFNIRPLKTPDKYKCSESNLLSTLKRSNYNALSTDNFELGKNNKERYYKNKIDHINECLRSITPTPNLKNKNQAYKRTKQLKKDNKKLQLNKSYDYNFEETNKVYKNISLNGKRGNLILGNDPTDFSSEYNSMLDYAKQVLLRKKERKNKLSNLNKSVDIPRKFKWLKRKNFNKRHAMKQMYTKNTTNFDINKSTDNINLNKKNNIYSNHNLDYYKSNIFFDKEKEKSNEELEKISNEYKIQRHKEKIRNIEKEKEKEHYIIKRRKTNFLYEDENKKKSGKSIDFEEYKKFYRNGSFINQYSNFKPEKELKIKSFDDEFTENNKKLYSGISETERNTDKFVILDINNHKFDEKEIKNLFLKNGMHVYGEKIFSNYIDNGKKGKFVFNIRKDLNDKDYNRKLKVVQKILMKKQGLVFNLDDRKSIYNKRMRSDISPTITTSNQKGKKYKK